MKKYDLYLFDFDGTLFDTMPALEVVFREAYKVAGVNFKKEDTVRFARIPLIEGYKEYNCSMDKWAEFGKMIDKALDYKEAIEKTTPYPETMEFLNYIKNHDINAGIVTSNNSNHIKDVLNFLNVDFDIFKLVIGNKECHIFKPHPDPVLMGVEVAKEKGLKVDSIAYVGDAINDMLAAKAAGVDGILIDRNHEHPDSNDYTKIYSLMELFNE